MGESQTIVSWDPETELACFRGPGGFTQLKMPQVRAEAIAQAMGAVYYTSAPGTNLRG